MYVLTTLQLIAQALADVAVGGPFAGAKIALYTNNISPSKNRVLADFTIADWGGLTNLKALTWGAPFANDSQQAEVRAGLTTWLTLTTPVTEVIVYGYVVTDTAGAVLLMAEKFATPYTFNRAGQAFGFVPRLVYDS